MPSGPKSNKFMNRHAVEAREREQERQANAKVMRAKALEDAMWVEDDPKVLKKQTKQREAEEKARQQAEMRAERREQLKKEEQELTQNVPQKVARRQIQKDLLKMFSDYDKTRANERQQQHGALTDGGSSMPLPDGNLNRGAAENNNNKGDNNNIISASGSVSQALSALQLGMADGASVPENRHIGKRARALYRKFHGEQLSVLREEKPGLRLTQYDELIWEMWQKNPTNPFVLRNEQRSKERLERERRWMEGGDEDDDDDDDES